MGTKENRATEARDRYPSDLTDEEWALLEPLRARRQQAHGRCARGSQWPMC